MRWDGAGVAGDEIHLEENWRSCSGCGYDVPLDITECPFCGRVADE